MKLSKKQKEEVREKIKRNESMIVSSYDLLTTDKPLKQRIKCYQFNLELLYSIQQYKYLLGESK